MTPIISGTSVDAALDLNLAVIPHLGAKEGIFAIAVEWRLDRAARNIGVNLKARSRERLAARGDILDVGIRASDDDMEVILVVAVVLCVGVGNSTSIHVALDPRSGCRVRASFTGSLQGVTLEEDLEEVASIGGIAQISTLHDTLARIRDLLGIARH
jgi:hypothetical protein